MVGCGNQQGCGLPIINRLQDHRYQALEFAHVAVIIAALGDRVELIKKQYTWLLLRMRQHSAHIGACLTKIATHHASQVQRQQWQADRKSTRLNSSHSQISYAVFCLKKKKKKNKTTIYTCVVIN